MASQPRTCRDCPATLDRRNKSGWCRPCVARHHNKLPENIAKRREGLQRRFANDPALREGYVRRAALLKDLPGMAERRRERWNEGRFWEKGTLAAQAPEVRARAGRATTATRLAWCPPELREQYLHLLYSKRFKAAEARRMIEDQHEADMQRWRRSHGLVTDPIAHIAVKEKTGPCFPADMAFVDKAIPATSELTGVHPRDITGPAKFAEVVTARFIAICALRRHYGTAMSFAAIGRHMGGRDHSTICHAVAKAEKRVLSDPAFAQLVAEVLAA